MIAGSRRHHGVDSDREETRQEDGPSHVAVCLPSAEKGERGGHVLHVDKSVTIR